MLRSSLLPAASTALVAASLALPSAAQEAVAFSFDGCQGQGVWVAGPSITVVAPGLPTFAQGFDLTDQTFCSGDPFAEAPPVLTRRGGEVGDAIVYSLSGRANEFYLLVPSFSNGPIPIDLSNPQVPLTASVGIDLVQLWVLGAMDAGGSATETLPLPPLPQLTSLALQSQFIGIDPLDFSVDRLSNRTSVRLHNAGKSVPSSTVELDRLGRHTATTLPDGRVVLTGGASLAGTTSDASSDRIDVYDVNKESFYPSSVTLSSQRVDHTATLLDDGRVMIIGGFDELGNALETVDLYDPATDTIAPAQPMPVPRGRHAATQLGDGRVLVVGGLTDIDDLTNPTAGDLSDRTFLYDPVSGLWSTGPDLDQPTLGAALTTLPSGDALMAGGLIFDDLGFGVIPFTIATVQRFSITTDSFANESLMPYDACFPTLLTLASGEVVAVGGRDVFSANDSAVRSTASFLGGTWTPLGDLAVARAYAELVETADGLVVGGGFSGALGIGTLERYDDPQDTWFSLGNTLLSRPGYQLSTIEDGERVLISGFASGFFNAAAELLRL